MKCKKAQVALKLDMKKAYDKVEWSFLFSTLHHPKWVELIKACITVVSCSIIVNDYVCGSPTRSIKQGGPLSPYLFIIYMEALTRALRKALWCKKSRINIKLSSRASKIPYLLFVDDSLLFYRTNVEACQELRSILNKFCQSSGQLINFRKSSLTFSSNVKARDN